MANSTGCNVNEYFDNSTNKCLTCADRFSNCASCNKTKCLLCYENYFLHPTIFDYTTGQNLTGCVFNTCPVGFCQNNDTDACEPIVANTITNCVICDSSNEVGQICTVCANGYFWSPPDMNCMKNLPLPDWMQNYITDSSGNTVFNRFVNAALATPLSPTASNSYDVCAPPAVTAVGTMTAPFLFPMQPYNEFIVNT